MSGETQSLITGNLFAGIGGFEEAARRAGAENAFGVEIDPKCNECRQRHFPDSEVHEDVTAFTIRSTAHRPGLITAGWPCQGNSVAGRRGGMADERSGLWGEVRRLLAEFRPRWFLGENVPGILSVNGGRDWLTVIRDLEKLGYGTAYRVLDAQYFGVPQRRRRVFVVGCLGDWKRAAEVLFESESLPWNSPPSRSQGTRVAGAVTRRIDRGGVNSEGHDEHLVASALDTRPSADHEAKESRLVVTHTLTGEGFDASEDGTGRGTPIVPVGYTITGTDKTQRVAFETEIAGSLRTKPPGSQENSSSTVVAYRTNQTTANGDGVSHELAHTVDSTAGKGQAVISPMAVRRLTPLECERLQGFPDGWTEGFKDSVRYRMLGNSIAVPCAHWVIARILTQ